MTSASPVAPVSAAWKRPCWKRSARMGRAMTARKSAEGTVRSSTRRTDSESVPRTAGMSRRTAARERAGRLTVAPARPDGGRKHERGDAARAGMPVRELGAEPEAELVEARELADELEHATQDHPQRERRDGGPAGGAAHPAEAQPRS